MHRTQPPEYPTAIPYRILHDFAPKKENRDWKKIAYIAAIVVGGIIAALGGLVVSGALPASLLGGTTVGAACTTGLGGTVAISGGLLFWMHRKNKQKEDSFA